LISSMEISCILIYVAIASFLVMVTSLSLNSPYGLPSPRSMLASSRAALISSFFSGSSKWKLRDSWNFLSSKLILTKISSNTSYKHCSSASPMSNWAYLNAVISSFLSAVLLWLINSSFLLANLTLFQINAVLYTLRKYSNVRLPT